MEIVNEFPPNIEEIRKVLDIPTTVVFTWGETLYNPNRGPISLNLLAHERTHVRQQHGNPEVWWKAYLKDPEFRLQQELEAYRNQYQYFCNEMSEKRQLTILERVKRTNLFLWRISEDLSGPIYGEVICFEEAKYLISHRDAKLTEITNIERKI